MIRAYLGQHKVKHMRKAVLIGTTSQGIPLVDIFKDIWWMKLAGLTASNLGTDDNNFPHTLPAPDYPLGIIAGVTDKRFFKVRSRVKTMAW